MKGIVAFFKDIFTLGGDDSAKIGLSQFKKPESKKRKEQDVVSRPGEIKLSDLMRKSC